MREGKCWRHSRGDSACQQEGGVRTAQSCLSGAESVLEKTNSWAGRCQEDGLPQEAGTALPVGRSTLGYNLPAVCLVLVWLCLFLPLHCQQPDHAMWVYCSHRAFRADEELLGLRGGQLFAVVNILHANPSSYWHFQKLWRPCGETSLNEHLIREWSCDMNKRLIIYPEVSHYEPQRH
jgi:hypothetical protein